MAAEERKEAIVLTPQQLRERERKNLQLKVTRLPTVNMVGPAGTIVVNQSDVPFYRGRGYKPQSGTEMRGDETEESGGSTGLTLADDTAMQRKERLIGLKKLNINQLKKLAGDSGLAFDAGVKKDDLIEGILDAEFSTSSEEGDDSEEE